MIKNLMKREEEKEKQKVEKKLAADHDGYAECYPGLAEMDDAVIDSDDEADFSKMDMGNKKGPVGRRLSCRNGYIISNIFYIETVI